MLLKLEKVLLHATLNLKLEGEKYSIFSLNISLNLFFYLCSDVELDVVDKNGVFDIVYLLKDAGTYDVDVKFGGRQVPDGLIRMTVK